MQSIGVVDERDDDRDGVVTRLHRSLRKLGADAEWIVLGIRPLAQIADYPSWIAGNDVRVLILDERLNEAHAMDNPYSGHDIVALVRPTHRDIPIYYLTAVPTAAEVEADHNRVTGTIDKTEFFESTDNWVKDFIWQGRRFSDMTVRKLGRLGELAQLVSLGRATEPDLQEMAAIRTELELPLDSVSPSPSQNLSRAKILDRLEKQLAAAETLLAQADGAKE